MPTTSSSFDRARSGARITADDVRRVRFDPAPPGTPGYDEDEVDVVLDLVVATLRGQARLTLTDVLAVRFSPATGTTRGHRGYDPGQVEDFMVEIAAEFERRAGALPDLRTGAEIRRVRLPRAEPGSVGYRASGVVRMLATAAHALDGIDIDPAELHPIDLERGVVTVEDARSGGAVPGYRCDAVDELLTAVRAELTARLRATSHAS